jgi:hypothetical protein
LVASEGSLPNSGWGYAPMLREFIAGYHEQIEAGPEPNLLSLDAPKYVKGAAEGFVRAFTEQQKNLALGGRSIDISAWDLDYVESLAIGVNRLAIVLNDHFDLPGRSDNGGISDEDIYEFNSLKKVLLQAHYDSQTYMAEQCVDIKDFCLRLVIECKYFDNGGNSNPFWDIKTTCGDIIDLVDRCVLLCGYSGDEYQFSNGVSLYFPWSSITYGLTDFRYRYLRFTRGPENRDVFEPRGVGKDWNRFLRNYLGWITMRPARKAADGTPSALDTISHENPPWSKDNPPYSKDNPPYSRDTPPWSRDNPPYSKDNPPYSRDNPPYSKGETGNYLYYFGRFKNFAMQWDIAGFSNESEISAKSAQQPVN